MPSGGRGPLHPVIPPAGLVPSLWGWSAWGVCLGVWHIGSVRHRAAPPRPAGRGKCIVVPCRLPPLWARARCARAPLFRGSLVCLGWCASSPLPPVPPSRVGGGLAVLCTRGWVLAGICSPLMPSRGVVAAAGNRRRATTCGGRPWLRGGWSSLRGLLPAPTHLSRGLKALGLFLDIRKGEENVKIFNKLLKICIFASNTSRRLTP